MEGFDYTNVSPSTAESDGAKFVVRYVGTSSKCITVAEKDELQGKGIGVGLVYETSGVTFSGGERAGLIDGSAAKSAAAKLGAPSGATIWFAIDTDTNEYSLVNEYLKGCQEGCGPYTAKLYGGYNVVENAPGGGHWQTYAWSGGRVSAKADLYQYKNGQVMDHDRTLNSNLEVRDGWLVASAVKPTPGPSPAPAPAPIPVLPPSGNTWHGYPGAHAFVLGERDDAVWVLGVRLAAAGFAKHNAHGQEHYAPSHVFSLHDLLNVQEFQKAQGWRGADANGIPGPATWQHLGEHSQWKTVWNG